MALMSLAMLLTALLPTYDRVGPAAGWALLALRCVMDGQRLSLVWPAESHFLY